jgi:hypothetical protein
LEGGSGRVPGAQFIGDVECVPYPVTGATVDDEVDGRGRTGDAGEGDLVFGDVADGGWVAAEGVFLEIGVAVGVGIVGGFLGEIAEELDFPVVGQAVLVAVDTASGVEEQVLEGDAVGGVVEVVEIEVVGSGEAVGAIEDANVAECGSPPGPYGSVGIVLQPREERSGGEGGVVGVQTGQVDAQAFDIEVRMCGFDVSDDRLEVSKLDTAVASAGQAEVVSGDLEAIVARRDALGIAGGVGVDIDELEVRDSIGCLEGCGDQGRTQRDKCRAHVEWSVAQPGCAVKAERLTVSRPVQ